MTQSLLSTVDNPFDPFEQFDEWFLYDNEYGYNSCSKLARVTVMNDAMTEYEKIMATEQAIDTIIQYDFTGLFIKVSKALEEQEEQEENV